MSTVVQLVLIVIPIVIYVYVVFKINNYHCCYLHTIQPHSLFFFFFLNDPAPTEISPLPLPAPLPISVRPRHRSQRVVRCPRSTRLDRARPPRAVGKQIEAHVGRDAVQPGTQRSAAVEPVEAAPGTNDGLLDRVVGVDRRSHHPVTVAGEGPPMPF